MRPSSRTPRAAAAALVLLAAPPACAPGPLHCPPRAERFDPRLGSTRESHAEVHPAMAVAAVAVSAAALLAGYRCDSSSPTLEAAGEPRPRL